MKTSRHAEALCSEQMTQIQPDNGIHDRLWWTVMDPSCLSSLPQTHLNSFQGLLKMPCSVSLARLLAGQIIRQSGKRTGFPSCSVDSQTLSTNMLQDTCGVNLKCRSHPLDAILGHFLLFHQKTGAGTSAVHHLQLTPSFADYLVIFS